MEIYKNYVNKKIANLAIFLFTTRRIQLQYNYKMFTKHKSNPYWLHLKGKISNSAISSKSREFYVFVLQGTVPIRNSKGR